LLPRSSTGSANYDPVLTVMQLGTGQPSTILGGVQELVASRMYPLATLVFFASVAVPMLSYSASPSCCSQRKPGAAGGCATGPGCITSCVSAAVGE
jgi:paraquat-inducible protein A